MGALQSGTFGDCRACWRVSWTGASRSAAGFSTAGPKMSGHPMRWRFQPANSVARGLSLIMSACAGAATWCASRRDRTGASAAFAARIGHCRAIRNSSPTRSTVIVSCSPEHAMLRSSGCHPATRLTEQMTPKHLTQSPIFLSSAARTLWNHRQMLRSFLTSRAAIRQRIPLGQPSRPQKCPLPPRGVSPADATKPLPCPTMFLDQP